MNVPAGRHGLSGLAHVQRPATCPSPSRSAPARRASYPITVSVADAGTGTYYPGPAAFTLTVDPAPVVDEPPTVTVTGVTNGASYEYGSVPTAGCHVVDDLDGTTDFAATLTAITGPRADDGLGSQTANCSYTDAGGQHRYGIRDVLDRRHHPAAGLE